MVTNPKAASQRSSALSRIVVNTGSRSPGEELMTRNTSAVAVCCCRDSRSFVEKSCVLDGDDCLGSEVFNKLDLFVREWTHFQAINDDRAHQRFVLEHGHGEMRSGACKASGSARRLQGRVVGAADHIPCLQKAIERCSRGWLERTAVSMEFEQRFRRVAHCGVAEQFAVIAEQN